MRQLQMIKKITKNFAFAFSMAMPLLVLASPHLELDLSSEELRYQLKKLGHRDNTIKWEDTQATKNFADIGQEKTQNLMPSSIDRGLKWGDKLSLWIEHENLKRSETNKLRLSDPKLRRGIPPEEPSKYSPKTIENDQQTLISVAHTNFVQVLEEKNAFPSALPWDDEIFLNWARKVNRIYQQSARYKLLAPHLAYYRNQKRKDIRGFLYLNKNKIDAIALRNFSNWDEKQKIEVKTALIGLCLNYANMISKCQAEWSTTEQLADGPARFYEKYFKPAETVYQAFFKIPAEAVRSDLTWSAKNINLATLPFDLPSNKKIHDYLQINIENEYRWNDWSFHLDFGAYPNSPQVIFKAGATPHVDRLGGNQIIMDANQSIDEYESQWTIRHEFGHVLGLPDCYIEFYDDQEEAFINYQIDTSDLMCSRAGNMNQRIYDELKRNYLKVN